MDQCNGITLQDVFIQENGIIRNSTGLLIGKLVDYISFERLGEIEAMKKAKEEK